MATTQAEYLAVALDKAEEGFDEPTPAFEHATKKKRVLVFDRESSLGVNLGEDGVGGGAPLSRWTPSRVPAAERRCRVPGLTVIPLVQVAFRLSGNAVWSAGLQDLIIVGARKVLSNPTSS